MDFKGKHSPSRSADSGRGSALVESLLSVVLGLLASGILIGGLGSARRNYAMKKSFYLARSTAESVYNLVSSGEDVPEEMNGFKITVDGDTVRVGRWIFEFEVVR